MGGVDHDALWLWPFAGKRRENPVKHAAPAPADEAVVERLVRAIAGRRILPLQAVLDHIDDAADNPPVVDPRHSVRQRKKGRNPRYLALAQQKQANHQEPPLMETLNHALVNRS